MVLVSLQAEFCDRKMDMAVRIDGTTIPHRWDEHAAFIDGLVAEGFIQFGGPLEEEGAASWSSWRGTRSRRGNGCGTIRGTRTIACGSSG